VRERTCAGPKKRSARSSRHATGLRAAATKTRSHEGVEGVRPEGVRGAASRRQLGGQLHETAAWPRGARRSSRATTI